jgi:hypothetical protein
MGTPPPPNAPEPGPRPAVQIDLTDEESRIMPVVGAASSSATTPKPVSITRPCWCWSRRVTQAVNDQQQVAPMLERLQALPAGLNQPE